VLQKSKTEPEAGSPAETDEVLIARVSCGDAAAFEILVNRYQKSALRVALRFTGRHTEAEDRAQEAFLQIHSHAHQYNPETAPFKTWFFAILSNLCRNAIKRNRYLSFIDLPQDSHAIGDPEGELASEEQRAALAAAIARLPSNQRLALILRYEEEFRYAEMSTALGISINAVRSLLVRAKRTLGRELVEFKNKYSD
jgi:RNA polymerase sigma-70 factor, ECF subfamily